MKYRDLIDFDSIEAVIQLRSADQPDEAQVLVRTYVISDSMADVLVDYVYKNLQFVEDFDHRGMLVVGNYGTGKSHLMAVLTSIAENENLINYVTNEKVRTNSSEIAGKFKVIRSEIGAVSRNLRDIVIDELEDGLKEMGVHYTFPSADEINNNKDSIIEMMIQFNEEYPDKGLLFALDELLEYLRKRNERELIYDLTFLRELGEVCKDTRFRFISGVQEAIFDSPEFVFAADSLRRVKDRFQEIYIKREDLEFVITERLLKKTKRRKDLVRQHLEHFSSYYTGLSTNISHYIDLFPIHPSYIDILEQIRFVEKRLVLQTLSSMISNILDDDVPQNAPGIITYDYYWEHVKNDSSYNTIPDVACVKERSQRLETKMGGFPRLNNLPIAMKIIYGLCVYRLTDDIKSPIGLTAEQLRDHLFVPFPVGTPDSMKSSDGLKGIITTIMGQIMQTVNGQFISFNKQNMQYYIDVDKITDYDQNIEDKSKTLSEDTFDTYYFDAIVNLMGCITNSYVPGFKIWEHELMWSKNNVTRQGYLFFGDPNSRSTAQPPRDFYIYFSPIFNTSSVKHNNQPDEVFFTLVNPEDELIENIKLYAGARELEKRSTVDEKRFYRDNANELRNLITQNLYGNMAKLFEVVHKNTKDPITKYINQNAGILTFKEIIDLVASSLLTNHFENIAPEYPTFTAPITKNNREQVVKDAIRSLSSDTRTKLGLSILSGLELWDGTSFTISTSKYAKHVMSQLNQKQIGVVLNHDELITDKYIVPYEKQYRLEPELLIVVLTALVREGLIEINISGQKYNAANLEDLVRKPINELTTFKFIQKPKDPPIAILRQVFKILKLTPGLVSSPQYLDPAVEALQIRIAELIPIIIEADQSLKNGLQLMNIELFDPNELDQLRNQLRNIKSFLESLQKYNTTGRLRNCNFETSYLDNLESDYEKYEQLTVLIKLVSDATPLSTYLSGAQSILQSHDPWVQTYVQYKIDTAPKLLDKTQRIQPAFKNTLLNDLTNFKQDYKEYYINLHKKSRLDATQQSVKAKLVNHNKLKRLNRLATLDLLPNKRLIDFTNRLSSLNVCYSLTETDLESNFLCPHCNYRPIEETMNGIASSLLITYENELETINQEWDQLILDNLNDPLVIQAKNALNDSEKAQIENITKSKIVPDEIPNDLLTTLKLIFTGLEKIGVTFEDLVRDLSRGGMPCTLEEYKKRFEAHLNEYTKGKDVSKLRIILEE